ncbi:MAG: sterol desaturase family protein, partial [Flavobacteriaceae bacterium]|nr:sterol desaturase family protein [Flavobacteriaceae bacterium]
MIEVPEIPNLIYFAIPFFIVTLIAEVIITNKKNMKSYTVNDATASLSMGIGNVLLGVLAKV